MKQKEYEYLVVYPNPYMAGGDKVAWFVHLKDAQNFAILTKGCTLAKIIKRY